MIVMEKQAASSPREDEVFLLGPRSRTVGIVRSQARKMMCRRELQISVVVALRCMPFVPWCHKSSRASVHAIGPDNAGFYWSKEGVSLTAMRDQYFSRL